MKWLQKLIHPMVAFIGIQIVWVLMVVLWIYWFVGRHQDIRDLATRYGIQISSGFDWLVLTEGLVLLLVILGGIYIIFLFWNRQSRLYREQKDFISQITHELKSPLASIQLHLETIRLRKPPRERLESFLDTMLMDTERLNNLISNLLITAKLEQRRRESHFSVTDFSAFLTELMERKRAKLPAGGCLTVEIEAGVKASIDMEEMETALRNLYENAVLYSPAAPDITVRLAAQGKDLLLTFSDRGMGIEPKQMKHIFRKFYRIRRSGENIRGSGLGLYIVQSVIRNHGGTIRVTSEGPGKGTSFIITLPLAK